jgi:hypothetical protein
MSTDKKESYWLEFAIILILWLSVEAIADFIVLLIQGI